MVLSVENNVLKVPFVGNVVVYPEVIFEFLTIPRTVAYNFYKTVIYFDFVHLSTAFLLISSLVVK